MGGLQGAAPQQANAARGGQGFANIQQVSPIIALAHAWPCIPAYAQSSYLLPLEASFA